MILRFLLPAPSSLATPSSCSSALPPPHTSFFSFQLFYIFFRVFSFLYQDRGFSESLFQKPAKLHLTLGMLVLLTQREVQQAVQLLLQCGDEVRYVGETKVEPVDDTVTGTSDNTDMLKLVNDRSI